MILYDLDIPADFDEMRNQLEGDITSETVAAFVAANHLPLVVDFNSDTAKQIFGGSVKHHVLMFQSAAHDKAAVHYHLKPKSQYQELAD